MQTLTTKQPYEFVLNPAIGALESTLKRIFNSVQHCNQLLNELRAIKQPDELMRMREAIRLTNETFRLVREKFATFRTEAEVEAEFVYRFHRAGAVHAYEPIVASGKNACTMHYVQNTAKLKSRDMVLIDIGARVAGYSADVTRTYCLNPTKRQKAVHAAVVAAEREIIAMMEPGLAVGDYLKQADAVMARALQSIGLMKEGDGEDVFRRYYPHAIGHGLGVDTHDYLGRPRYLEAGMVMTVEPGIYIPEEGIGVRIEDDILITDLGHENLSKSLPTDL